MPRVVATPSKLLRAIRRHSYRLIAIDGSLGAGKTTRARYLGRRLGIRPVHLDDYVAKRRGAYAKHIKRVHVQRQLAKTHTTLIDGICVLQVLGSLGVLPDILVYVKRVKKGLWIDQDELDLHEPVDLHLAHWHEQVSKMATFLGGTSQESAGSVTDEVIRYHAKWQPHRRAGLLYLRDDA